MPNEGCVLADAAHEAPTSDQNPTATADDEVNRALRLYIENVFDSMERNGSETVASAEFCFFVRSIIEQTPETETFQLLDEMAMFAERDRWRRPYHTQ